MGAHDRLLRVVNSDCSCAERGELGGCEGRGSGFNGLEGGWLAVAGIVVGFGYADMQRVFLWGGF